MQRKIGKIIARERYCYIQNCVACRSISETNAVVFRLEVQNLHSFSFHFFLITTTEYVYYRTNNIEDVQARRTSDANQLRISILVLFSLHHFRFFVYILISFLKYTKKNKKKKKTTTKEEKKWKILNTHTFTYAQTPSKFGHLSRNRFEKRLKIKAKGKSTKMLTTHYTQSTSKRPKKQILFSSAFLLLCLLNTQTRTARIHFVSRSSYSYSKFNCAKKMYGEDW